MTVVSSVRPQFPSVINDLAARCISWTHPVALACSGGVDSTALLILAAAAPQPQAAPFVVVHVDHRTRVESGAEGVRVVDLCMTLGVPCVRTAVDPDWRVGDHVAEHRLRRARYDALARVAQALQIERVMTAHTLDDQVETVLMRLFSGTSASGASGMRPESVIDTAAGQLRISRPLLDVPRRELVDVLTAANVIPVDDPSNADRRYTRNVLRHEIIPAIQREFPGFPGTLLRSVGLAQQDAVVVDAIAEDILASVMRSGDSEASVDRAALRDLPQAVATRVVVDAARRVSPASGSDFRELTTERIRAVVDAASGRTGALIQLPYGVDVLVERDVLLFARRSKREGAG